MKYFFLSNKKRVTRKVTLFRPGTPQSQCQLDGAKVVGFSDIGKYFFKKIRGLFNYLIHSW